MRKSEILGRGGEIGGVKSERLRKKREELESEKKNRERRKV